jgi:MFS family permease
MQSDLHIGPVGWGWITGVFTLSYAIFEIPTGALGDRIGSRKVLTRVVLWWSAFTSLTGAMVSFPALLLVRFCFGAGEAGAFPNASVAINRWFPIRERSRAFGTILMSSQLGGALAPLLVLPIQIRYGWRASFYAFGILGVLWAIAWYTRFRDSPAQQPNISPAELEETRSLPPNADHAMPWSIALRSPNLWAVLIVAFCYVYPYAFFQTWFHTYLVKGRGYSEADLFLSILPYLVGATANLCGGAISNLLVRRIGLIWGRRSVGILGLGLSALAALVVIYTHSRSTTIVALCILYGGITLQQPNVFSVCLDIGGKYAGATTGAMNTAAMAGAFVSSLAFGYLVRYFGNYTAPFIPMVLFLVAGSLLWTAIDPTRPLIPDLPAPIEPDLSTTLPA